SSRRKRPVRIDRGGPLAAGLALCLGALTACNDSSGASTGEPATPPAAGAPTTPAGKSPAAGQRDGLPRDGDDSALDPGHDGRNAAHPSEVNKKGKTGGGSKACDTTGTETKAGYPEHAFTWDVSNRLAKLLRGRGAKVTLTRKD